MSPDPFLTIQRSVKDSSFMELEDVFGAREGAEGERLQLYTEV